jgi:acetoacetyl-CoA reductase
MNGRVAIVTGGIRGLGGAITKKLLEEGATVVAIATNQERCDKWAAEKKAEGFSNVDAYECNVSCFNTCAEVVGKIIEKYGKIDILVNNAGIIKDKAFKKMDKERWDQVLKVNLDSLFNMTRNVIENMLENGYGRIINISSVNGRKGAFGQANYATTKAAMYGFTKTIALETASKGITVNSVSPGYCNTEMMQDIPEDIMKKIVAQIPVGRLGEPSEIADAVAFLASDKGGFMTGSDISINGGQYML